MSLAARLSTPLRRLDAPANAISDVTNAAVPWLWWPLAVPAREAELAPAAHALYAVHTTVVFVAARRAGLRVSVPAVVAGGLLSWLWFTGAWDRRAARRGAAG